MDKKRYLTGAIVDDLADVMVFVGGARQVGKTTLARTFVAPHFTKAAYLNWDNQPDRKAIRAGSFPGGADLVIFDEVHKYDKWKNLIKGIYDTHKELFRIVVTGSARLDVYRRGGDSLRGRYHYYRLHPFTLAELTNRKNRWELLAELAIPDSADTEGLQVLDRYGGFPEVLLKQSDRFLRRWHNEKSNRLFREEIRDLGRVRDIGSMQLLGDLLPNRVGSLLSVNALREDIEVSHRAVTNWLDILEMLYYHYRIYPYAKRTVRSIKKEPKLYLYDWSEVAKESARFENLVASHLLKMVHFLCDRDGHKAELKFLRNVDKKEVDFLVTIDKKPWFCVEAKLQDTAVDSSIQYYRTRLNIPFAYQVVKKNGVDKLCNGVRVISADRFLCSLI